MMKLDDMATGFGDGTCLLGNRDLICVGVLLINLLEIISSKEIPKYNKNPKIRTQKCTLGSVEEDANFTSGKQLVCIEFLEERRNQAC
jgi:hypothetical protein